MYCSNIMDCCSSSAYEPQRTLATVRRSQPDIYQVYIYVTFCRKLMGVAGSVVLLLLTTRHNRVNAWLFNLLDLECLRVRTIVYYNIAQPGGHRTDESFR